MFVWFLAAQDALEVSNLTDLTMVSGYLLETRQDDEDDDNIYLVIKVTLFCLLQCLLAQFYLKGRLFKNSRIGI